jgi:hypothetical protein
MVIAWPLQTHSGTIPWLYPAPHLVPHPRELWDSIFIYLSTGCCTGNKRKGERQEQERGETWQLSQGFPLLLPISLLL